MFAAQATTAPSLRVVDLVTTDSDKKFEPAARMADAIIAITHKQGRCLPHDIYTNGFTPDEVTGHWHMARALAAVEFRLRSKKAHAFP